MLAAEKRSVVTPAQIVRKLAKDISLPAPIALQPDQADSAGASSSPQPVAAATSGSLAATPGPAPAPGRGLPRGGAPGTTRAEKSAPNGAFIPRIDLKPLYDFTLDCQACQAKLSTAQNGLADERQKTAALTKERDGALRIAKGGSAWRRRRRRSGKGTLVP